MAIRRWYGSTGIIGEHLEGRSLMNNLAKHAVVEVSFFWSQLVAVFYSQGWEMLPLNIFTSYIIYNHLHSWMCITLFQWPIFPIVAAEIASPLRVILLIMKMYGEIRGHTLMLFWKEEFADQLEKGLHTLLWSQSSVIVVQIIGFPLGHFKTALLRNGIQ